MAMFVAGLTMVLDIRGAARGMSQELNATRPMGVDYSKSFISSVGYARFVGGAVAVVAPIIAVMFSSTRPSEQPV